MDEALKEVLKYGFEVMNLTNIDAFTHHGNQSSINLLLRNGFKLDSERQVEEAPSIVCYAKYR
jgi:ribosomal-protein-alanine N-acetyltransferase